VRGGLDVGRGDDYLSRSGSACHAQNLVAQQIAFACKRRRPTGNEQRAWKGVESEQWVKIYRAAGGSEVKTCKGRDEN
jgi:hypothetical protein